MGTVSKAKITTLNLQPSMVLERPTGKILILIFFRFFFLILCFWRNLFSLSNISFIKIKKKILQKTNDFTKGTCIFFPRPPHPAIWKKSIKKKSINFFCMFFSVIFSKKTIKKNFGKSSWKILYGFFFHEMQKTNSSKKKVVTNHV